MDKKQIGRKIIVAKEGTRLKAYDDGVGVITIANGITVYPCGDKKGQHVKIGETCTLDEADEWLDAHLSLHVYPTLEKLHEKYDFPDLVYAALISFAYNEGAGRLNDNDLVQCYESQEWGSYNSKNGIASGLAAELIHYDLAGGRHIQGLKLRRIFEVEVMLAQITI